MDDFLKKIAGVQDPTEEKKQKQEVQKKEVPNNKNKKEKAHLFHIPKKTQKSQQIKISLEHHKRLKSVSKRKGVPVTQILEYILNHTFEKYEL